MKIRAREALQRAVDSKRIVKPDICQSCGEPSPPIEAHHTDYTKPLAVEWLCEGCHEDRHIGDLSEQQLGFVFSGRRGPRYDPLLVMRDIEAEMDPAFPQF